MGVENITNDILNEANSLADSIIKNAENKSFEIIEDAKKQAEEILNQEEQKSKLSFEGLKNRMVSSAELQRRKMILSTKQQGIKDGFNAALNKLKNMPEQEYINYLANEIMNIPDCGGVIVLNERDKNKIGSTLVQLINERLKDQKLQLGEGTINTVGGFLLKNGDIVINSTFETLLDSVKDEMTNDVANTLFN